MKTISASVGIRNGKQCYNVVSDQLVIIGLLNSIPGFAGGTKDKALSTAPRWGVCSDQLAQAILTFQQRYSLSMDGHVDPGGMTIIRMNQAAGEQNVPLASSAQGKVGSNPVGVSVPAPVPENDDYWKCTGSSLSTAQIGAEVTLGAFSGSISFARGTSDRAFMTLQGFQTGVGIDASTFKAQEDLGSRAKQLVMTFVKSAGFASASWDSGSVGPCVSLAGLPDNWRSPLDVGDFAGACCGINVGAGTFVGGLSGWALFFGLPKWIWAAIAADMLASVPTFGASNLILLAGLLKEAKGVAFIGSLGWSFTGGEPAIDRKSGDEIIGATVGPIVGYMA